MNETPRSADDMENRLQVDWTERQRIFGNAPQAVLLRNLPARVNDLLDEWHRTILCWSLAPVAARLSGYVVDLGCGYGRLANEALQMGFPQIVGLDYEAGFCRRFFLDYGFAVRGSITRPPFSAETLSAAYSVTALMYVHPQHAANGMLELDNSLKPGARILLLEAGAGFNKVARIIFRRKRMQALAVNGFSRNDLESIVAPEWKRIASGSNAVMTCLLPLLLLLNRWPRIFARVSRVALWFDQPRIGLRDHGWRRFCLHRWILCEKLPKST